MLDTKDRKEPIFRLLDIHVSEIKNHPNTLKDMIFNRHLDGAIIRDVFSKETLDRVVYRLEKSDIMGSIFISPSAKYKEFSKAPDIFGQPIVGTNPNLHDYFAYATAFRKECRKLFQDSFDFEEQIESILRDLSGNLPVRIPNGPEKEQTYASATIRVLPNSHEIKVHVGNEFHRLPQSHHLNNLLDLTDQLSYFVPLSVPEAGGELVVYTLEWDSEERNDKAAEIHHLDNKSLEQYNSMVFAPGAGDLLIFDGGRYYHRVTPVIGSHPRRTIGGFLAFSRDRDAVYYWS